MQASNLSASKASIARLSITPLIALFSQVGLRNTYSLSDGADTS